MFKLKEKVRPAFNFLVSFVIERHLLICRARSLSLLKMISLFPKRAQRKAISVIGDELSVNVSVKKYAKCAYKNCENFENQEVVLLAHWDQEKIIDPYVLYAATHLKKCGKKIILCSANPVKIEENLKIFSAIIYRICPGYDFTSWKCAFEIFPSLFNAKEITFTNDSIFSPIGSYENVYNTMKKIDCDYWGIILSRGGLLPHLQSFFLVFREKAVSSSAFNQFISAIKINSNKEVAVKYEYMLAVWLELNGLHAACFRPYFKCLPFKTNLNIFWYEIISDQIPLLKRSLLKKIHNEPRLKLLANKYNYPYHLINNYYNRTNGSKEESAAQ